MDSYILAFLIAGFTSYMLTPYAKKFAHKIGAIDVPKDNRRVHKKPIPRLGGLAIYIAFVASAFMMTIMKSNLLHIDRQFVGIMIGATIIVLVGIVDDSKQISAKYKLLGQIIAALVVVYSGVRIEFITNILNQPTGMTWLEKSAIPVTVFWIVGITNTVNLIDGLDGLAAGISSIAALSLAYVAYLSGQTEVMVLLIILAGSLLGFLPYNFNPAEIFMGDTGSLLVGFILATISIEGLIKSATTIAVAIPVLALGIPIFDTTFAIVRRLMNGRPIMEADKGHLHHRLLDQGLSQKQTVLVLYFISMLLGASAIVIADTTRAVAYLVIASVSVVIFLGALRIGLIKKPQERKANS
ncbi:undecaprenyl-phosphate N-acetylglucosaminyl 1-phosphate transferase TagO [Clostridium aceticum]|uniref:Undecaprenyl-phosphate N-acetylglucosaminyl 1-phosphate transferase TagO n=1 Tax=Clostridium aceticum TaxID=84022 RepID=A0A0D8I6V5_9CLOT|nr:MraY family glycosyltransferase [Clostridium aceticum]AKL93726.1 undecaprenyl-phosphate N-acetylglucosaminyl 1-phosphate transferase TagO [Clostridium aceticum]KJF25772.1 glycosyl transferase [Clostridium aceticum]